MKLHLNDDRSRYFFQNCHIERAIDFIFGSGRSLYDKFTIKSIAEGSLKSMRVLGLSTEKEINGFVFVHCEIVESSKILLGRA